MKPFWKGFETKTATGVNFKKHVIVLYWDDLNKDSLTLLNKVRLKYPTVKVKTINGSKYGVDLQKIKKLPTILLLKDGREKNRLTGGETKSQTLLSRIFQEAST